ncbi:PDZ domain-containing protein [Engelhardtia mirabilis]|uniref:PDZ domain-containing protein n=1 Tax=Engelhardtia mirabilis TaxID=2528011 RepID=A0A518BKK1_9BACT|nr:hypothetical protein Pla133_25800 [Planctomycetes bacterium Pla133]QDV01822.1 hypothetical protein Pla86_25790 [Planctomycetes bacterium Pla86]
MLARVLIAILPAGLGACAAPLALQAPPLAEFSEPVALLTEPDDEALRQELPLGSFSGLEVGDSRDTLASLTEAPVGLTVTAVVENSPAAAVGLEVGDLLLEARVGAELVELSWPSQWRALELENPAGTSIELLYDRAGSEREVTLTLVRRVAPAGRGETERFREDDHVGVVLRTATEVEARTAGLAPGAGAVIVGLAASSPWRDAELRFADLITAVDGVEVASPEVLLDAIRRADRRARLSLEVWREGQMVTTEAAVSRRISAVTDISLPLIFSYERRARVRNWSAILGLLHWESTSSSWRLRLLWLFNLSGGETDRLQEVDG